MPKPTKEEILADLAAVRKAGGKTGTFCTNCGGPLVLGQKVEIRGAGPLLGAWNHNRKEDCQLGDNNG